MGTYIQDHPTHFDWRPDVRALVRKYRSEFPWQAYWNTYYYHPPYNPPAITRRYDAQSFDVWGGGVVNGVYRGYRGKPLNPELGDRIWRRIWHDPEGPRIWWVIWAGKMYVSPAFGGRGWGPAPSGPPDSDPGHWKHIHCTFW